jgi:type IV secretion system protein VirB1
MSLTVQAALALALRCAPAVDPHMVVAIAQHESGLDPLTIHDNTTGQILHGQDVAIAAAQRIAAGHSVDLGLMQINSKNLSLLGLPLSDAFVACKSVEAAARLLALFSKYNTGSPTRGAGYATRVMAVMDDLRARHDLVAVNQAAVTEITEQQQSCNARPEDVWERDACEPPEAEGDQER